MCSSTLRCSHFPFVQTRLKIDCSDPARPILKTFCEREVCYYATRTSRIDYEVFPITRTASREATLLLGILCCSTLPCSC